VYQAKQSVEFFIDLAAVLLFIVSVIVN